MRPKKILIRLFRIRNIPYFIIFIFVAAIMYIIVPLIVLGKIYPQESFEQCSNIDSNKKKSFQNHLIFRRCLTTKNFEDKTIVIHDEKMDIATIVIYSPLLQSEKIFTLPVLVTGKFGSEKPRQKMARLIIHPDVDYYSLISKNYYQKIKRILVFGDIIEDSVDSNDKYAWRFIEANFCQFGVSSKEKGGKCGIELRFSYIDVPHNGVVSIVEDKSTKKILLLVSYYRNNHDQLTMEYVRSFIDSNPLFELLN